MLCMLSYTLAGDMSVRCTSRVTQPVTSTLLTAASFMPQGYIAGILALKMLERQDLSRTCLAHHQLGGAKLLIELRTDSTHRLT